MKVAIIPARSGSKRLPHKHTRLLNGLPLIAHTILYAQQEEHIDKIFISTDDTAIKDIAHTYKIGIIDRPPTLATDHTPTIAVLQHAIEVLSTTMDITHIITLQATSPLRPQSLLTIAFQKMLQKKRDSLFTVSPTHKKLGKIQEDTFYPYSYSIGTRSQELTPLYFENGLLYITHKHLIQQGIIFNEDSYPLVMEHPFGMIDIDTEHDFLFAEHMMQVASHFEKMPFWKP